MRVRDNWLNDLLRIICFFVGLFCGGYVVRGIHNAKLDVPVGKGKNAYVAVVSQAADPAIFWALVVFISLIAIALFYCAFFAKNQKDPS